LNHLKLGRRGELSATDKLRLAGVAPQRPLAQRRPAIATAHDLAAGFACQRYSAPPSAPAEQSAASRDMK